MGSLVLWQKNSLNMFATRFTGGRSRQSANSTYNGCL